MVRHITTLQALGKETSWLLLQQARGIPEANAVDDFMTDRTMVQMFSKPDMSERLCTTAAVRQMSGHIVYVAPEDKWQKAIEEFPVVLLGAISYYMDGLFVYGLPIKPWTPGPELTFPIINCGAPDAHPAHAIADIVCMLRTSRDDLRGVKAVTLDCSSANPNCLFYTDGTTDVEGLPNANVVCNGVCDGLLLTDVACFYCPMAFTATDAMLKLTPKWDDTDDEPAFSQPCHESVLLPF